MTITKTHLCLCSIHQKKNPLYHQTKTTRVSLSPLQNVKMPYSLSPFSTETLISKAHLDFSMTSEAPSESYTENSFITSVSSVSNTSVLSNHSCTYKEDFKRILLPAVYTLVFVLGLPLNAAVILKIWRTRPNLSKNNIYMLNLALADFLYVMSLPLLIYNYGSHDYWPFGEFACKMVRFQFYR